MLLGHLPKVAESDFPAPLLSQEILRPRNCYWNYLERPERVKNSEVNHDTRQNQVQQQNKDFVFHNLDKSIRQKMHKRSFL
jgi:hypothetical protein